MGKGLRKAKDAGEKKYFPLKSGGSCGVKERRTGQHPGHPPRLHPNGLRPTHGGGGTVPISPPMTRIKHPCGDAGKKLAPAPLSEAGRFGLFLAGGSSFPEDATISPVRCILFFAGWRGVGKKKV